MCDIRGQPLPNINWYKNGNPIINDVKVKAQILNENVSETFLSDNDKYLQISNAHADNFGEYSCVAENYLGQVKQSFDVIHRPYWSEFSDWSECSEICGNGFMERHRICHHMKMHENQSIGCIGDDKEVAQCIREPCRWSKWSECSRTCGSGQKYRYKGKFIEIVPCMRTVCNEKNIDRLQYTPLITYESHRDTNKVLQQLNRNKNHRDKTVVRMRTTKATNHLRSSRSAIWM